MQNEYDVIIVGGSYAGLSAAMSLGRALRSVLVIDSGKPCNRHSPHSHNFLTQDGQSPSAIAELAKAQVIAYPSVNFTSGVAISGRKTDIGFEVSTENGAHYLAKKLIFATGVKDHLPAIDGFSACWGKTVIHCPYCHGYEARQQKTGLLGNGDDAFEFAKLLWNWTNELTLYTNGKSSLNEEQHLKLKEKGIKLVEKEIVKILHQDGQIEELLFADQTTTDLKALYARVPFEQSCAIPQQLGCELTETGLIKIDHFQKTCVDGVYACGDSTSMMRSVANAVYSGNLTGAIMSKELISNDLNEI